MPGGPTDSLGDLNRCVVPTAAMLSYLESRGLRAAEPPLRAIRPLVNAALDRLSPHFAKIYSTFGRESIALEKLLRAPCK